MSKKSQREAEEKKREQDEMRRSRFLGALQLHLDRFGELLPRPTTMEPLTENGIAGYEVALRHLRPEQLDYACEEALKVCTFFPKPTEILKAYADWLELQPTPGTATQYRKGEPLTESERAILKQAFAVIAEAGEPMKGMRWNREDDIEDFNRYGKRRENGYRPREESLRREMERDARQGTPPKFHVVGKRIAPLREPGDD